MVSSNSFKILTLISILSIVVPLLAGIARYKTLDKIQRVLFYYIIFSCIIEVFMSTFAYFGKHNYFFRYLFILVEGSCLPYIYYQKIVQPQIRKGIVVLYATFIMLFIITYITRGGYDNADNVLNSFEAAIMIFLSNAYTYRLFKVINLQKLSDDSFHWANNAVLIYFSGNFVIYLYSIYIEKFSDEGYYFVHGLHLVTNVLYNFLLSISLWRAKKHY